MTKLDEQLRNRLDGYQSEVPSEVWDRIEMNISEENNNRFLAFFWMASMGVMILLTLGTYFYLTTNATATLPVATPVEEKIEITDEATKIIMTESKISNTKTIDVENKEFIDALRKIQKKN